MQTILQNTMQDIRYALRQLHKNLGFTAIAVISLGLAIGANTTIFSFANQLLYVQLGVPHPEQLHRLVLAGDEHTAIHSTWGSDWSRDGRRWIDSFSYPVYQQLQRENHSTGEIFAFKRLDGVNVTANGAARVVKAELVSGNFYAQMLLQPEIGRPIQPADDMLSVSNPVAVISDALWHSAFGGAADVLGQIITVDLHPVTIVGVNPPNFHGPDGVGNTGPEVYLPLALISVLHPIRGEKELLGNTSWFWLQLMSRTRPDTHLDQAEAALTGIVNAAMRGTITIAKDETTPRVVIQDGSRGDVTFQDDVLRPIYVLLGLAGLVLLLACANIANLMLARAAARQREMSVRLALGAGRARLMRQVLTESLLLSTLGGAAGLALGYLGRNLIPWLMSTGRGGGELAIAFDWRVFGFTAAITLSTGLLFGLAPAWVATRAEISTALKEGSRSATRKRKAWSGKVIVGLQVALSTMLVIAAVFFLRTLLNLHTIDPGFRAKNVLLFNINPPVARYPTPKDKALHHQLEEALAAVPGVESVSLTNVPFIAGSMWNSSFHVEGAVDKKWTTRDSDRYTASLAIVGPQFFSTMSIPILAGRGFTAQDTDTSQPVSVINQELARKFFPNVNPIGKRFRMHDEGPEATHWTEIVGICANTRYHDMKEPQAALHFDLYRQVTEVGGVTYLVRSRLAPATLLPSIRRAVQQIDPDLPISDVRTQQQQIDDSLQQETMFAALTAGFGVLALALACVGIYGIMAYTVAQRTNEIGIRLALGAMRGQVRGMVLREAGWLAAAGAATGLIATLLLIRLVKSMLYGLSPTDPLTLTGSVLLLLAMALVAGFVPANRASHIEPIEALRHD